MAYEVIQESGQRLSIVLQNQAKEIIQPSAINKMFELEFVEQKNTSERIQST